LTAVGLVSAQPPQPGHLHAGDALAAGSFSCWQASGAYQPLSELLSAYRSQESSTPLQIPCPGACIAQQNYKSAASFATEDRARTSCWAYVHHLISQVLLSQKSLTLRPVALIYLLQASHDNKNKSIRRSSVRHFGMTFES
jgi:hypothetical protein